MLNISLCFNRKDFEYDVYSLIKAFYPGCEITSWYEEDGAPDGEFAYYDKILYAADQICFSIENEKHEELSAACEAVEYEKDRHETKNVLKRMVYRTLSKVSGCDPDDFSKWNIDVNIFQVVDLCSTDQHLIDHVFLLRFLLIYSSGNRSPASSIPSAFRRKGPCAHKSRPSAR